VNLEEGLRIIADTTGKDFDNITYDEARPGDQPYFVADLSWVGEKGLQWAPRVAVRDGIERMVVWIREHREEIQGIHQALERKRRTVVV